MRNAGVLAAAILAGLTPPAPTSSARSGAYISVAFSPDGKRLVTAGCGLPIKIWDVASGKELHRLAESSLWAAGAAFTPDGKGVISVPNRENVTLYDLAGTAPPKSLGPYDALFSPTFALSADGKTLIWQGEGNLVVWDVPTATARGKFAAPESMLWAVALDGQAKRIVGTPFDKTVLVWEVPSGKEILKISTPAQCYGAALSPDGRVVAGGGSDGGVTIWDVASGKAIRTLEHAGSIRAVAFRPDGKVLASGSEGQVVKLWDVASGKELRRLSGGLSTLAFSPDGKLLASGGDHHVDAVWIWDAETGKELHRLDPR
jgi:WD40 repeat protein